MDRWIRSCIDYIIEKEKERESTSVSMNGCCSRIREKYEISSTKRTGYEVSRNNNTIEK